MVNEGQRGVAGNGVGQRAPGKARWTSPRGNFPGHGPLVGSARIAQPPIPPAARKPKPTKPSLACWLQGTAPDGVRFDLARLGDSPGEEAQLCSALGPTQALAAARQLERRGWTDVRLIRRRLTDLRPLDEHRHRDPELPCEQRQVRLVRDRFLATEVPPTPSVAALRRGAMLAQHGDWSAARDALRTAVESGTTAAALWRSLGIAQGRCGEWRYARRALEQAVALGDEVAGQLLPEVRQIETLTRATRRHAWDPAAHRQLGLLLMSWERADEALRHLERAATLAPRDLPSRMALGLEMLCRSRWADALDCYTLALELAGDDVDARAAAEQGQALARSGSLPDAPSPGDDAWVELLAAG